MNKLISLRLGLIYGRINRLIGWSRLRIRCSLLRRCFLGVSEGFFFFLLNNKAIGIIIKIPIINPIISENKSNILSVPVGGPAILTVIEAEVSLL